MDILEILKHAVEHKASDIHLSAGEPPHIRIDGDLNAMENQEPISDENLRKMLTKIIPKEIQDEMENNLDIDFAVSVEGLPRFRANIFHQYRGISLSLRVFPEGIPTIKDLGLPDVFYQICDQPHGLILVTGPTGSGKTTTLASMLNHINAEKESHIITIEDPIEYIYESKTCLVDQRQYKQHTAGFDVALRAALREDPDYILVGEMRDLETIRLALTAAETGHLVFATLHTNSAPETIDRVIDVFPAAEKSMVRSILANSLQAVISQRLLKRIGGGRVAALEIMLCNSAIRSMIREDKIPQIYSSIQTGHNAGMCTLEQHVTELIEKKIIDGKLYNKLLSSSKKHDTKKW